MRALQFEHNDRAWLAWHIAFLSRMKKIPSLSRLKVHVPARRRQSWQEQMKVVRALNAALGGKEIKEKR